MIEMPYKLDLVRHLNIYTDGELLNKSPPSNKNKVKKRHQKYCSND